jgi:hypothetical protein
MANRDVILSLSKDPLTSILSLGGERKIKETDLYRGKEGDFLWTAPRGFPILQASRGFEGYD